MGEITALVSVNEKGEIFNQNIKVDSLIWEINVFFGFQVQCIRILEDKNLHAAVSRFSKFQLPNIKKDSSLAMFVNPSCIP